MEEPRRAPSQRYQHYAQCLQESRRCQAINGLLNKFPINLTVIGKSVKNFKTLLLKISENKKRGDFVNLLSSESPLIALWN